MLGILSSSEISKDEKREIDKWEMGIDSLCFMGFPSHSKKISHFTTLPVKKSLISPYKRHSNFWPKTMIFKHCVHLVQELLTTPEDNQKVDFRWWPQQNNATTIRQGQIPLLHYESDFYALTLSFYYPAAAKPSFKAQLKLLGNS